MLYKKKHYLTLLAVLLLTENSVANKLSIAQCKTSFPHWNCQSPVVLKKLDKLVQHLKPYAGKGEIAAFDWDGTAYSESIKLKSGALKNHSFAGQPGWFIYMAEHKGKNNKLLPAFVSFSGAINQVLFQEGRTNAAPSNYGKFSGAAALLAGMRISEINHSIKNYLKAYPVEHYVFYKTLDVMQYVHNHGFKLWIITGSNPYFVSQLIHQIESKLYYKPNIHYKFDIQPPKSNAMLGNIVGNDSLLNKNGEFTQQYNAVFTKNPKDNAINPMKYPVDKEGKARAIQYYIEPYTHKKVVFYAGNSDGDYEAIHYVFNKNNGFIMFVRAQKERISKKMASLLNTMPDHCIEQHSTINNGH
ncbi:HAD family hydrolase [Facilibium subflavum]|uniref:hypothetical protein n=1 Tax=Facilibium subflavum TaxID=2219058 RepID=UPI000E655C39|nr:hypothetical protein [Facilibium subflavum]